MPHVCRTFAVCVHNTEPIEKVKRYKLDLKEAFLVSIGRMSVKKTPEEYMAALVSELSVLFHCKNVTIVANKILSKK
jgi:hypothetical protein